MERHDALIGGYLLFALSDSVLRQRQRRRFVAH